MATYEPGLQALLETYQELAGKDGEQRLFTWLAHEIGAAAKQIAVARTEQTPTAPNPAAPASKPPAGPRRRGRPPLNRETAPPPSEPMLQPEDAAELIGRDKKTLANWRTQKLGPPYYRFGGRIRYRQSDITAWIDASKQDFGDDHGQG